MPKHRANSWHLARSIAAPCTRPKPSTTNTVCSPPSAPIAPRPAPPGGPFACPKPRPAPSKLVPAFPKSFPTFPKPFPGVPELLPECLKRRQVSPKPVRAVPKPLPDLPKLVPELGKRLRNGGNRLRNTYISGSLSILHFQDHEKSYRRASALFPTRCDHAPGHAHHAPALPHPSSRISGIQPGV